MTHIIKNYKWVIATSLICIVFGLLTFFTFTNQSFITLKDFNLQILLFIDLILLVLFFILIVYETFRLFSKRKKKQLGSKVNLKYILYFSSTTLLPSIIIAIFSLILFNVGLQRYFDDKIKSVVNNSAELAKNYVDQSRNSIETDVLLMLLDLNNQSKMFYENPNRFLKLLTSQRLLRRLDEAHLIDSSANLIMSNIVDPTINFVPPPEDAFTRTLDGKPVRIVDSRSNRTSALVKLDNFIDTYLYIVRFMDPKIIGYLQETDQAVSFYFTIQESKTGLKITFGIIYLLVVTLFLFLAIIISINFASRLTQPIINLIGASEKISSGDLNAKVPKIDTDDDLKKLNQNFNLMIEKLKKQQDKLLLTERHAAWESVARKLAHEIKNPLTPIQLSIDRIREKYLKNSKETVDFSKYLDTITKQIHDIEHLVTEFSDFARMPKPIFKKINLVDVVTRAVEFIKISSKNEINLTSNEKKFLINGDSEQLNRVFINLIKNSEEAFLDIIQKNADFKGKIDIDIISNNDYIVVKLTDNGTGITDTKKAMTPYFTTKTKGTGLGLPIVNKIINEHSGDFSIKNKRNDKGINIDISFPNINA